VPTSSAAPVPTSSAAPVPTSSAAPVPTSSAAATSSAAVSSSGSVLTSSKAATSSAAAVASSVAAAVSSARAADADDAKNPEADRIDGAYQLGGKRLQVRDIEDSSSAYVSAPFFAPLKLGELPLLGFGAENQVNAYQPTLVGAAPNMMLAQLGAHIVTQVSKLFWAETSQATASEDLQPSDCQETVLDAETLENTCSFVKLLLFNLKSSVESKELDTFLQVVDVAPSQHELSTLIGEVQQYVDTLDQSDPAIRYASSSLKRVQIA